MYLSNLLFSDGLYEGLCTCGNVSGMLEKGGMIKYIVSRKQSRKNLTLATFYFNFCRTKFFNCHCLPVMLVPKEFELILLIDFTWLLQNHQSVHLFPALFPYLPPGALDLCSAILF